MFFEEVQSVLHKEILYQVCHETFGRVPRRDSDGTELYTLFYIFLLIEQQKLAPLIGCLFTTGIANQFETA